MCEKVPEKNDNGKELETKGIKVLKLIPSKRERERAVEKISGRREKYFFTGKTCSRQRSNSQWKKQSLVLDHLMHQQKEDLFSCPLLSAF